MAQGLLPYLSMNLGKPARLPLQCCFKDCLSLQNSPDSMHIVRKGFYRRSSDGRRIARFKCRLCRRSFSNARFSECFGQRRRKLNDPIRRLLVAGVSQRRIALLLNTNRKTVVRKFLFLAGQARLRHERFLESFETPKRNFTALHFDEMESFERSKCLPVSIPLVVVPETRKILGIRVCSMPAKGLLAQLSRQKYGVRSDGRAAAAKNLFQSITKVVHPRVRITSDQNPKYPHWLRARFPQARHETTPGRRGCVVGQGELKSGGYDPLFALNHTCAMIRANVNRLFRRTWCTTKRRDRLEAHLAIYLDFHNTVLT